MSRAESGTADNGPVTAGVTPISGSTAPIWLGQNLPKPPGGGPDDDPPPGYFSSDNVDEIPVPADPSQPCTSGCCASNGGHGPAGPPGTGVGGIDGPPHSGTRGVGGIPNSGMGTDSVIRRDPSNGDKGCATTQQPVRALDGMPVVTATDLSSDSLGFMWGQTRSWTGLNNGSLNGWTISQLPYLVVGGGTNGSCDPHMSCNGVMPGTTPDDRISVVEGGTNAHTFTIPVSGPYTSYAPWGAEKTTLTWLSSATPPVMALTDSFGDVTQFYDVYRDATGRPVPHSLSR